MPASLRTLRPRTAPYATALGAFRGGRLLDAIDGLRGHSSADAVHLLARTWLRLREPERALDALDTAQFTEIGFDLTAERTTLRAATFGRLGRHDEANELLDLAIVQAISSGSAARAAEAYCYRASGAFIEGDFESVEDAAQEALAIGTSYVPILRESIMPLSVCHARAHELIGLAHRTRSRYREQLEPAQRAFELSTEGPDRWLEAFAIANLAVALRDVADDGATVIGRHLGVRALAFDWTEELGRTRHVAYDALGTLAAMRGDHLGAFGWYRRAHEAATRREERVDAHLARAALAHELDQDLIASEELSLAIGLADQIDWTASPDDFRVVLLDLALTAAPSCPAVAIAALERYHALPRPRVRDLTTSHHEHATRALERLAAGVTERHAGDAAAAAAHLTAAFELWDAIGFGWRATQTAIELAELGHERFRRRALAGADRMPGSWLARRASCLR